MTIYRHKKRGTLYRKVCTLALDSVEAGLDEEPIILCITLAGELKVNRMRERRMTEGSFGAAAGRMQATDPVPPGTPLVVYIGLDDGKWWFRPEVEFNDGRFEVIS